MMASRFQTAARWYAEHMGWRVHPCRPGEKRPLLPRWQERASTDPADIDAWWTETPEANVAIATGPASGLVVLDVDGGAGGPGERSLVKLEEAHRPLPDLFPMQWTGSGGWQAFFEWPADCEIRNSAGRLGEGLDTRGTGGFVVAPPSLHPSGNVYRWADDRSPVDLPPEPMPAWLVDLLDPPQAAASERQPWSGSDKGASGDRRALKALESELALVALAGEGQRNNTLNKAAHALFRFVVADQLPRDPVCRGLLDAAQHAGLSHQEAQTTIASAARARGVQI